jgi:hypothetical protein
VAKGNFDENIRQSMKPKSPRQTAIADGAGEDQAATGREVFKAKKPPAEMPPPPQAPQMPDGLPPHLAAAASIAHAIINNRPAK